MLRLWDTSRCNMKTEVTPPPGDSHHPPNPKCGNSGTRQKRPVWKVRIQPCEDFSRRMHRPVAEFVFQTPLAERANGAENQEE